MSIRSFFSRLSAELDAPADDRRFGTGWISGSIALLAALAGLLLVVALRNPTLFTMPELAPVRESATFRFVIYGILILAYALAITSLILRQNKLLGTVAMVITLLATFDGSLPAHGPLLPVQGVFFGLDFFVLNVLFLGLLFVPLERLFPRQRGQTVLRAEWREDLFYYLVSSLFVQVLSFFTLIPANAVSTLGAVQGIRGFFGGLPFLVQILVIMVLTDIVQYWVHRLFHQVPALWRFHAVHHSAQAMDWIAGARMHFLEIIVLRSLTATPMFALGFDPGAVQVYILIVYVYSSFIHANIGTNFGLLERFIVVPRYHHWHHGIEREAIDVNFAIHFPLLDRLFGTHHMPDGRWPEGYGIAGHPVPRGYWRQFLYPFRRAKD